jgi:hypothetical protein
LTLISHSVPKINSKTDQVIKYKIFPGMVVSACNGSIWEEDAKEL